MIDGICSAILSGAREGILITGQANKPQYANKRLADILLDATPGHKTLFLPDDEIWEALTTANPQFFEALPADGATKWLVLDNGKHIEVRHARAGGNSQGHNIYFVSHNDSREEVVKMRETVYQLFDGSRTARMVINYQDLTIEYVNPKFLSLLALEQDCVTGTPLTNLFSHTPVNMAKFLMSYLLEKFNSSSGTVPRVSDELKVINKRFEESWYEIHVKPVDFLVNMDETSALVSIDDVSRARRNEQELLQNNLYLNFTLNSIAEGVIATDRMGMVIRMNPKAEELTGWKESHAREQRVEDVFRISHVSGKKKIKNPVIEVLDSGKTIRKINHTILYSRSGKRYHITDSASPIRGGNGETLGAVLIFKDNTEKYELTERLRASEEHYRKLVNHAPVGILQFDENFVVQQANTFLEELFHYSSGQLEGVNLMQFPFVSQYKNILEDIWDSSPRELIVEYKPLRNDKMLTLNIVLAPVQYEGVFETHTKGIAIVQDVSKQKMYEERLKKARNKAKDVERMKSRFLSNISHEIRTPLNWMLGTTDLLRQDAVSHEERQEYLGLIDTASNYLLDIIDNILAISQLQNGDVVLEKTDFILNNFVQALKRKASEMSAQQEKVIPFDFQVNGIAQLTVNSDERLLRDIIQRLLHNAIKFTPSGQQIQIGIDLLRNSEKAMMLFYVKDYGAGLPEERQLQVFKAFNKPALEHTQGTGLGLAIAKGYAEMLDGKIWVESKQGYGSIFYLMLPVHVIAPPQDPHQLQSLYRGKVLLYDNHRMTMRFMRMLIASCALDVIPLRAIEHLARENARHLPDLILVQALTCNKELLQELGALRKSGHAVGVIVVLAFGGEDEQKRIIEAGANQCFIKPVPSQLLHQVFMKSLVAS